MPLDYDFLETKKDITIYFYIPPKTVRQPIIELVSKTEVKIDGIIIQLYDQVDELILKNRVSVIEIKLTKSVEKYWRMLEKQKNTNTDRDLNTEQNRRETELSFSCEDPEKTQEKKTMMEMLQDIYNSGDSRLKEAMNKSFIESKGSVLSTDLDKVNSGVYKLEKNNGASFEKNDVNKK